MTLLNLGCGRTAHSAWVNLELVPSLPDVIPFDIRQPLPFAAETVDAVYHSHLIEHFSVREAAAFLCENYRVLKPNGVIRIATPDLERIARLYLDKLERASQGETNASEDYDWMVLELFDQIGREASGGEMATYLRANRNAAFVDARIGCEAESFRKPDEGKPALLQQLRNLGLVRLTKAARQRLATILAGIVGGADLKRACVLGLFRQSGEVHRLLYDRYSLARLLENAGFKNPRLCGPRESLIAHFDSYHLDTTPEGRTRKPDSLFMEATKNENR